MNLCKGHIFPKTRAEGLGPSQPRGRICLGTFCGFLGAVGLSTRGKALRVRLAPELNVEKDELKEASPGSSQKFRRSGHASTKVICCW